jgi:hypothetical protein
MRIKTERFNKTKTADRQHFMDIGLRSSDVYYINEDKHAAKLNGLRGGSRIVAESI